MLGTLPYYEIPPLELGPLTFYPFGFLVGVAIIVGTMVATGLGRRMGLGEQACSEVSLWAVVGGLAGAHLGSALFYFPERVLANPLYLLKFWDGISSYGGYLGGALGIWIYVRRYRLSFWPYADVVIYGLVWAMLIGRIGCTVAFDHPGMRTEFLLGMPYPHEVTGPDGEELIYPAGTVIHNLGFYEMLWLVVMGITMRIGRTRPHFSGWYMATALFLYCPVRFALDFLRVGDETYFGFTPGHYASAALFVLAAVVWLRRRNVPERLIPDGAVHVFADGRKAPASPEEMTSGTKGARRGRA